MTYTNTKSPIGTYIIFTLMKEIRIHNFTKYIFYIVKLNFILIMLKNSIHFLNLIFFKIYL